MFGAADLEKGFHAIRVLVHTTDMVSKGFLSSVQVTLLDLKFDDWDFSDWKWLLHHLDMLPVCNQISKQF